MRELMDFVKELSFVRVGGSAEEKRAAELIMGEVNWAAEEAGREDIRGEYMTFQIPGAKVEKCSIQAAGREIPCVPFLRSGSIDRECGLVYMDEASEIDFAGVGSLEGKVVPKRKFTSAWWSIRHRRFWLCRASITFRRKRLPCMPGDCGKILPETE